MFLIFVIYYVFQTQRFTDTASSEKLTLAKRAKVCYASVKQVFETEVSMMQITIKTDQTQMNFTYDSPVLLSRVMTDSGLLFPMPCGGNGTCGKCKVRAAGQLSPLSDKEKYILPPGEIEDNVRLACFAQAVGDVIIHYSTDNLKIQVQEQGIGIPYELDASVKKIELNLTRPTVKNPISAEDNILTACGGNNIHFSLLNNLSAVLEENNYHLHAVVEDSKIIGLCKPEDPCLGVAIDIGTTTVACYVYDLQRGENVQTTSAQNRQSIFGADVISRIASAQNGNLVALKQAIVDQINALVESVCDDVSNIYKMVITGNTTMLHLLCGIDPVGIAAAPFAPASLFGRTICPAKLGIHMVAGGSIFLPRCFAAYVGADILCAILAGGMTQKTQSTLLIDIGTNGEMALCHNGNIICCSTAAGPAFEGTGLSMGMAGVPGAISKVSVQNGEIHFETIGNLSAKGVCGSGIVDILAVMLEGGIMDESGIINETGHAFESYIIQVEGRPALTLEGVTVTQNDIRQIQLAKASMAAGIRTLLHHASLREQDLGTLQIAGGFGSFIDKQSAARIGLIPSVLTDRTTVLGNAAGSGAAMLLLSQKMIQNAESIAQNTSVVELSNSAYFMEQYVECMFFE